MFWKPILPAGAVLIMTATLSAATPITVLYGDRVVKLERTLNGPREASSLWVTAGDLTRINGFVLKPEGACLDELCIPVPQSGKGSMVRMAEGRKWFDLTAFAKKVRQVWVADRETGTWSFGEMPVLRSGFLQSAFAPDFSLPDRHGSPVRLSDHRGKKVLLLTWASW